ncbi:U2-type spliceosomal complex subunit CWC21 [Aspergillus alliaceus]|uniref:U2-type spliceosomal complex subunit CWC21 n=1 Tax=Petromyces alliaceus TaxID=209559 RepID=UPI0012A6775D|nr:cwf21 domain-containing protein [Aspergillus alliaceus]KAB8237745.1 cwf21 domain-containing protein [Aspergillus alliaceus]
MSSNVGLTTPRGSGTSGYVQKNWAFMKPRNAGYGAPYPPVGANGDAGRPFKQRQPDKQILEHDRRRAIEVKVMEERERLEEENERIEEENAAAKRSGVKEEGEGGEGKVLSDEEIEERCEALRARLVKEMEEDDEKRSKEGEEGRRRGGCAARDLQPRDRRQFKSYQVHELAEAKIEESERLRKALGIKEDRETGEISSGRRDWEEKKRERERGRS